MKKILILANSSGGLFRFRKELVERLIHEGNDVYISTPNGDYIENIKKLKAKVIISKIYRRSINPIHDLRLVLQYLKIVQTIKPDLIITYTIKPNIYGGIISRILRIPYVSNITGLGTVFQKKNLIKKLVCILYKISEKSAKIVFFENVENKETFLKLHLIERKQAHILNGAGVNLVDFPLTDYPKNNNATRFLFIGRIMKEKGVDELFDAIKKLISEGTDCSLDIVGPYEENYAEVIKKYVEEGWLHYHGYQKDVRPFIANCHCAVLPSWHEGMSNVNLECASMGRPIITSDIHGCKEAVVNGTSGILVEKKNTEDLKRAMQIFDELPYQKRKEMGIAARKLMESKFSKERVVAETISVLQTKYLI